MAFTRKFLSSLGIEEDKVDTIITAHAEVVDALKDEINRFKEDAEKLPEVQKKLDEAVAVGGFEDKYNALKQEYDDFKTSIAEKETYAKKVAAYKSMLKGIGVAEKRIDTVVRADKDVIESVELNDDGSIKDDKIEESAKKDWADFIVTEETHGSNPAEPPENTGGKMSKEEIMKIKDTAERQRAIAENHEEFGF